MPLVTERELGKGFQAILDERNRQGLTLRFKQVEFGFEPGGSQLCRKDPVQRGFAGMEWFRHRPERGHEPDALSRSGTQGIHDLLFIQAVGIACSDGSRQPPKHGRRVNAATGDLVTEAVSTQP